MLQGLAPLLLQREEQCFLPEYGIRISRYRCFVFDKGSTVGCLLPRHDVAIYECLVWDLKSAAR